MTDHQQPEALQLADWLDAVGNGSISTTAAAAELRRLHAENEVLRKTNALQPIESAPKDGREIGVWSAKRPGVVQLVRADEREKHQENNLMAECMDMVRDDLIRAGIISEEVPPMMLPEAIKRALKERVEAEREKCAQVCDRRVMGDNNREDSEARRCADAIRAGAKEPSDG